MLSDPCRSRPGCGSFDWFPTTRLQAPLMPETRYSINAQRLAKMQRDAILFNTSCGPLVDAATLIEVLKRDTLGGVALDV